MWNTRHGAVPGAGTSVDHHPEPGFEKNGKTKEENQEDNQKKLFNEMKKERELGGLMNVKNEDKVGKDLDKIPSLKTYDSENGLSSE